VSRGRLTAEERKLAIVQAALPLFARKGFAETTTKELAKAAGVSEPLLYRHFPSKEALYLEIQNYSCRGPADLTQKLADMPPSAATLVYLIYYLLRAVVLGLPAGAVEWDTRHRLMLKSLLEDGSFARLLYRSRFAEFCSRMEACLEAAIRAGEMVENPVHPGNRALFAYHVGAWLAVVHLPPKPAIAFKTRKQELLRQAVWFALRGMGMTDAAIAKHYDPKTLERFFGKS